MHMIQGSYKRERKGMGERERGEVGGGGRRRVRKRE